MKPQYGGNGATNPFLQSKNKWAFYCMLQDRRTVFKSTSIHKHLLIFCIDDIS